MIRGIHHTSFSTLDLDRLLRFYRDLLGLEQLWDISWEQGTQPQLDKVVAMSATAGRSVTLKAGNAYLEFFQYGNPPPGATSARPACDAGIRHVCFDVEGIEKEFLRLSAAGVEFLSEPQPLIGVISVYGRDPDGNLFELQEILPGSTMPGISTTV